MRDVVAHERRRRERFGQQHHGAARPAADVGDGAAGAQALGGTVEQRHDVGQQVRPVPGLEPALAADRTLGAAAVVVVADAGAEALGDRRQCRHRGRELVEQPESGGLVVGVGEHGDRLGRQREPFIVVDRDEAGGRLVVGPLADPPLDETGSSGQLGRRGRAAIGERPVQPEPVTEMHHARGHRAFELGEQSELELLEGVGIDHRTETQTVRWSRRDARRRTAS